MRPKLVPELICSDIERSLRFYIDVLGFQILYARPEERFAFLDRNGAELMLEQPYTRDRLWPQAELVRPFGRGLNLEIQVEDVAKIFDDSTRAGLSPFLTLEERWYRKDELEIGVRQFALQDPDGYLIRLSQSLGARPRQIT